MAELKDLTNHESVLDQINQYHNLISLTADQLQDLKVRVKALDNGNYEQEHWITAIMSRNWTALMKLNRSYTKH